MVPVATTAPAAAATTVLLLTLLQSQAQDITIEVTNSTGDAEDSATTTVPTTRRYILSFTSYTTPTPLPDRPDWTPDEWIAYFEKNHTNFWFLENLRKNKTAIEGQIYEGSSSLITRIS